MNMRKKEKSYLPVTYGNKLRGAFLTSLITSEHPNVPKKMKKKRSIVQFYMKYWQWPFRLKNISFVKIISDLLNKTANIENSEHECLTQLAMGRVHLKVGTIRKWSCGFC